MTPSDIDVGGSTQVDASQDTPSVAVRYHSLDALRCYAMLLGIVFHAAWFFVPYYFGTTFTDCSGNTGFHAFFYWAHVFRMQVFFLIAGFFARLVYQKRGRLGFAAHRLCRIAFPFAVGWAIMYPLFTFYYLWGGLKSGRILSNEPFWALWVQHLREWELDGFILTHLWFLYYLILLYALTIACEVLFATVVDRKGGIRQIFDGLFRRVMQSRWTVILLTIPLWGVLWWGGDLFGITTPSASLVPHVPVLTAYAIFFLAGWFLHAQPDLLQQFDRRWTINLGLGILMTIPLFLYFDHGVDEGKLTSIYPLMWYQELRDYPAFREELLAAHDNNEGGPKELLWKALSPEYQQFLRDHDQATIDQQAGLVIYLNENVILDPDAFTPENAQGVDQGNALEAEAALQNRAILEAMFPTGVIAGNGFGTLPFEALRFAFMGGYALSTWLLVFGFIGLFNRFFADPNPTVRYIADSSYWLYLIHLPILYHINILVADAEWHWLPKFMLYNVVAFGIMIPSYHYLVRSTLIGKILNGRKYPFRPWFHRPNRYESSTPAQSTT